jgi:hypothetical protein
MRRRVKKFKSQNKCFKMIKNYSVRFSACKVIVLYSHPYTVKEGPLCMDRSLCQCSKSEVGLVKDSVNRSSVYLE